MKNLMHTSIAAALIGLSMAATAQTPTPVVGGTAAESSAAAQHARHRPDPAKWEKKQAERQAKLKTDLAITPNQEAAWSTYTTATQHQPPAPGQKTDWAKLTTPQRLDEMQAHLKQRQAEMQNDIDATRTFYAALTPEQQKTFDKETLKQFDRHERKDGDHDRDRHKRGHSKPNGSEGSK